MVRDLVIALSLSNLCFINAWRFLLMPSSFSIYHQKTPTPVVDYFAVMLDVLLLAMLFFAGVTITRRLRNSWVNKLRRVVFVLVLCVPLYALLMQIEDAAVHRAMLTFVSDEAVLRRLLSSIPLTISLFVLLIALLRIDKAVRVGVTSLLILAPFVLITFSQTALSALKNRRGGDNRVPFVREIHQRSPRVLWLVFDELDFRTAFLDRPSTVKLPELDNLASQSLFAENAYPPAGETLLTMPALITGRLVSEASPKGSDELMIKFGDNTEAVPWGAQPNIFSRSREGGLNTALVGWYHPYCRILGNSLTTCAWEGTVISTGSPSLAARMYAHTLRAALLPPLAGFFFPGQRAELEELVRRKHASDFESIYRQALEAAINPNFAVVLVHLPIPHPPNIYSRSDDKISVASDQSYLDNLELVDVTLRDVRRAMECNGIWDRTVVLVTSDHWWRTDYWKKDPVWTMDDESALRGTIDRRVPFILKMARAGEDGADFGAQFNTVLTHDLLLAILGGEVSDIRGAAAWLDRHRSIGRSPYDERRSRTVR